MPTTKDLLPHKNPHLITHSTPRPASINAWSLLQTHPRDVADTGRHFTKSHA